MSKPSPTADQVARQLARLRDEYLARLPGEIDALRSLAKRLPEAEEDAGVLDDLHHGLHKLAGSGGTFGLPALSVAARALEQRVKRWLDNDCMPSVRDVSALVVDIDALGDTEETPATPLTLVAKESAPPVVADTTRIWLVEDDAFVGQELVQQLHSFNYEVRLFSSLADAERALPEDAPDMLIMDVMLDASGENTTAALPAYPGLCELRCPLLFVSSMDDFQSRVRAAKLGAKGYFLKPLDVPRLVNRMVQIFESQNAPAERVLIVDDDCDLATHYRLVLMAAGMRAEVLEDPATIIEAVSAFRPELVLMDLHMPSFNGPDLAGVIRQHEAWDSLPIVYLSAETDLDRQIDAMSRGADDFLTKPVSDAQLVAAVRARISRARQLDTQIARDSLTGLLKHASIKEAAEVEISRACRTGKPVTMAILDIDHFKSVNDSYGHAVGDVVISSVAMLLRQRMRRTDILGRYGGEEFVAVLPDCELADGVALLDDIRRRFADIRFNHAGQTFTCTLSAGVSCSSGSAEYSGAQLLVAADEGLYAAKRGGRNQVREAGGKQSQENTN